MTRQKKIVFVAAYAGIFVFGICAVSVGFILPDVIIKYSISEIEAGVIASLLPFGILAGSSVFGPVVDSYGYRYLLIFCILSVILALEGIAYSENLLLLKTSVFVIGFGGGMLNGSTSALISDISESNRGANLSVLGVFFGIGAFGMPLLIGILSGRFTSSEIISTMGYILFIPLVWFFFIDFPKSKIARQLPFKTFLKMAKDPVILLIGAFLFFQSGVEGVSNSWTTTYLRDVIETDKEKALFGLSALVLSLTLARILLGYVLRKISPAIIQVFSVILAASGAFILMLSSNYAYSMLGLIILGAGLASGFPVLLGYVGELYVKMSGTAFSFVMVIALTGNMIINYLMGVIAQVTGMHHFPSLLVFCFMVMLIILIFVIKHLRLKIKV